MAIGLLVRGAGLAVKGIGKALKNKKVKKFIKNQIKDFKDADKVVSRRFPKGTRTAGTAFIGGVGIEKATEKAKKRKKNRTGGR